MSRTKERPLPLWIGDRAVEAMYLLARDIRSSAAMRQQPLFDEIDEPALDAARLGIVSIVLRVAFILHAEGAGILPLGNAAYDRRFALTTIGEAGRAEGAWRRLVKLSELLSGAKRVARDFPVCPWYSVLFDRTWTQAFQVAAGASRGDSTPVVAPSDQSILDVIRTLGWAGKRRLNLGAVAVEQVAGVYERLVGHEIVRCAGASLRLGRSRVVVDLEALLATQPARRADMLARWGIKPSPVVNERVQAAENLKEMATALRARRSVDLLPVGTIVLQPSVARRRSGAHYTPAEVAREVVAATLRPLLEEAAQDPERILALRVCDPAMGTGGFVVESCRQLAEALADAWRAEGCQEGTGTREQVLARARFEVASRSVYGLDLDPLPVELARLALRLAAVGPGGELPSVNARLCCGDALVGIGPWGNGTDASDVDPGLLDTTWIPGAQAAIRSALKGRRNGSDRPAPTVERVRRLADRYVQGVLDAHEQPSPKRAMATFRQGLVEVADAQPVAQKERRTRPFHWPLEYPEVFTGARPGFDVVLGNPPWVAYAGRAAQPIVKSLKGYFLHVSPAFRGYRTLQGLFVHRGASLIRAGGRMGFVLPTSMSDLAGYAPVRRVHDAMCEADIDLPDFGGSAFDGVFQPSMALLSTRRAEPRRLDGEAPWAVRRDDLEEWARALLDRLAELPVVPSHAFGERGFQSMREDRPRMRSCSGPTPPFEVALRVGTDIRPFERLPARTYLDPTRVGTRLRPAEEYRQVGVLVRQTARYPIAALSDGLAFRNSVLAGFAFDGWPATALVAYLNAWPLRWLHFMRNRDARQGMPQVKISHLRSLPMPRVEPSAAAALDEVGRRLGQRNTGITVQEQDALDALVAGILGIRPDELAHIEAWRIGRGLS